MATFSLTKDADTFQLDTEGAATLNGQAVGTWKTNPDNRIVILGDDDTEVAAFDVVWKFNENNQLCVHDGENEVFNFFTASDRPFLFTKNAVLHVRPRRNHIFEFELRGEWNMTQTHDLEFVINEQKSVIDGFVESRESRFNYFFFDKTNPLKRSILGFIGSWDVKPNDEGVPLMTFHFKREDESTDTFSLPEAAIIDTAINQFVYEYQKENRSHRIILVGVLKISSDFTITYTIDRQQSSSGEELVSETTFTLEASFSKNDFQGSLALVVQKTDGTKGNHSLVVGGTFRSVLGATKLQVGFNYSFKREGNIVEETFGFNGNLTLSNEGRIFWAFDVSSTNMVIELGASDIVIGDARAEGRLNIVAENGQVVGVRVMLGVAF